MKAPYLTIGRASIDIGETYYTVDSDTTHELRRRKAGKENNVVNLCYFFDLKKAEIYRQELILLRQLQDSILRTEKGARGK